MDDIRLQYHPCGVWLPAPDYMAETSAAYEHIFTYVPRIVIGSLVGFVCGELSNAWLMERIKQKTEGKRLWVRTVGSSIVGYLLDTVPFVLIAFVGVVPMADLILMIFTQYFVKLLIEALLGTPMAYAVIGFLSKRMENV